MINRDKMVIGDIYERISLYDLEGSFDDLIDRIRDIRNICAKRGLLDARLRLVSHQYDDGQELAVVYDRPMNDAELALEAENERRSSQYRRAEYERLRKEFEGQ